MDNREASRILRENGVDTSFDPRQPQDILEFLVNEGHLLGMVLESTVETMPVSVTNEV